MLRKILLFKLALLTSLFLAEMLLQHFDIPANKCWVWTPNLTQTFQPDSGIFSGINGTSKFTINKLGYRGYLFEANTENYLCLGGSTTECLYLDDRETWASLFQQALNSRYPTQKNMVGNLGKSGVSAYDNYLHLKYYVPQLSHVKGIVFMVGLNDAMRFLKGPNNFDIDCNLEIEEARAQKIFQRSVAKDEWWSKFKLTQLLHQVYHQVRHKEVDWLVQDTKGETLRQWRQNRQATVTWIDTLPLHEYALQHYNRVLEQILVEAKRQSIKLYFVNQASMHKDTMTVEESSLLWMGGVGEFQQQSGNPYYTPRAVNQLLKEYNQVTADFCAKNNLPFVDISSTLPKDTSVFYDDCHFNENGARQVAKEVAKLF